MIELEIGHEWLVELVLGFVQRIVVLSLGFIQGFEYETQSLENVRL